MILASKPSEAARICRQGGAVALLLATLLSGCAAPSGRAPVKPQELGIQLLARAEQAIHERGFVEALALCEQAAGISPDSADVHGCRGESLFHMARYRKAEQAYREAYTHDPTALHALHRAWAAHLQHHASSPRARKRVTDEIEASRTAAGQDPEVLLAVVRGYGYLHQRDKQLEALRRLVPLAASRENRESAASLPTAAPDRAIPGAWACWARARKRSRIL